MSSSNSPSATSDSGKRTLVSCPQCGASVVWDATSRYRPFCSERCKMIDLGSWATESYRIPVSDDKDTLEPDEPGDQSPRN